MSMGGARIRKGFASRVSNMPVGRFEQLRLFCSWEAAYVLGYFERDINPAFALTGRSLEFNPSFAVGWARSG